MKPSLLEQREQGALVHSESLINRQPTHADLRAAFEAGWDGRHKAKLIRIFIGVPCMQWLWQPFVQSLLYAFMPRELEVSFAFPHSHFLHMSRSDCIKGALDDPEVDFLLMVDSDQIFGLHTIPRLLSWNVPVVSPVIVQRNGPPTPVAYREVGKDENGYWRYEAQTDAVAAYVSQFRVEDWEGGHVANLPLVPYRETAVKNIPDEIKKGLGHPLMPCDATGLGMTLIRRDVLESLVPDEKGLYMDSNSGGEDFSLMRNIRKAGWGGMNEGPRGWGIFYDRGCFVGHLSLMSKGMHDLVNYREEQEQEHLANEAKQNALPPAVPYLLNEMQGKATPAWLEQKLPGEAVAV